MGNRQVFEKSGRLPLTPNPYRSGYPIVENRIQTSRFFGGEGSRLLVNKVRICGAPSLDLQKEAGYALPARSQI
jgi:hypothetical protein